MLVKPKDYVVSAFFTNQTEDVLFFTNYGKVYRIRGHQIPEYSRTSKGIPAINLLKMDQDEKVRSIISINKLCIFVTNEYLNLTELFSVIVIIYVIKFLVLVIIIKYSKTITILSKKARKEKSIFTAMFISTI